MRTALLFALAALLVFAAPQNSVAGKWSGTVEIKTPDGGIANPPMNGDFQCTDGKTVSGTVNAENSPDMPIAKGAFDGEKFTFTVTSDEGIVYELSFVFDGPDKMNGTVNFTTQDGTKLTGKIVLNRQKTT